jgi:PrtD family type I secretion system ABC transporter
MSATAPQSGRAELAKTRQASRHLFLFVALFSMAVNLLMLTGPLYMLQVYDRVLGSRSVETLIALSLLATFLFAMMGLLDHVRGRVMGRVAARFQAALDQRVFQAMIRKSALRPDEQTAGALRDLEAVQRLLGAPAMLALFDLPWTPLFLFGIFLFHPWLGYLAVTGGLVLVAITILNQISTRTPVAEAAQRSARAEVLAAQLRSEAEMVQSLGMGAAVMARWRHLRDQSLQAQLGAADRAGLFTASTKTFRLFLQSAMLGLGAYLVLQAEVTAGAMIAGSILLGRALAPVELAVGQWASVQRARQGWLNLADLLGDIAPESPRTPLPVPKALLEVQQLTVFPPGEAQPVLRALTFSLQPGQAVGVIGVSGAGKSSLARALTGAWRPAQGSIRLDGATLDQYDPATLGRHIGYLPQRVQLFEGTIAENIAKMATSPDAEKVVQAARRAGAHEMILKLPQGYDTLVPANGGRLSGGQMQRIALARALYDDPVILVLDEPNSNLDTDGSAALNQAILQQKQAGKACLVMAHRPAAIQECDMLLVLDNGHSVAFGPRDEVLRKAVHNHQKLAQRSAQGGMQ